MLYKFRIFDKENKIMDYCDLEDLCEDDYWYDGETEVWSVLNDCNNEQERFIIMQWTQLKDKNGKEIYEGDIVYVICEDENAVIEWEEDSAKFSIKFDDWIADFDCYYGKDLEVIGNIYENPELLNKGDDEK